MPADKQRANAPAARPALLRHIGGTLAVLALLAAVGGVLFVYLGVYNVAATRQHTAPVYAVIDRALRYAVGRRADDIEVPPLAQLDWRETGVGLYQQHCRRCHGAPGMAPDDFALGMKPVPTAMVETARKRTPAELFWVVEHGIKMTGMPAWRYRLSKQQIWLVVAAIERMPYLTVPEYAALAATASTHSTNPVAGGRAGAAPAAERGRHAMQQYGCVSCHVIPGVTGAIAHVGPPLNGMASRSFIAGVLPNTRENMVKWLLDPPAVDPLTAMPALGVAREDAEEMAAYLATLQADR